jgi:hypothetical protein
LNFRRVKGGQVGNGHAQHNTYPSPKPGLDVSDSSVGATFSTGDHSVVTNIQKRTSLKFSVPLLGPLFAAMAAHPIIAGIAAIAVISAVGTTGAAVGRFTANPTSPSAVISIGAGTQSSIYPTNQPQALAGVAGELGSDRVTDISIGSCESTLNAIKEVAYGNWEVFFEVYSWHDRCTGWADFSPDGSSSNWQRLTDVDQVFNRTYIDPTQYSDVKPADIQVCLINRSTGQSGCSIGF